MTVCDPQISSLSGPQKAHFSYIVFTLQSSSHSELTLMKALLESALKLHKTRTFFSQDSEYY